MNIRKIISFIVLSIVLASPLAPITHAKVKHSKRVHHVKRVKRVANTTYYTNVSGHRVRSPVVSAQAPSGASAECRDGSFSFSEHRRGTCSHHGGVKRWLH